MASASPIPLKGAPSRRAAVRDVPRGALNGSDAPRPRKSVGEGDVQAPPVAECRACAGSQARRWSEILRRDSQPPTPSLDINELGRRAKDHHQRIVARAREAARDYWLLGSVLNLAKPKFKKGQWYAWLGTLEISRHRADRGRLLARAFKSPDALDTLTIEEAEALAKRIRPPAARKLAKKLRRRLGNLAKSIVRTADESAALGDARGDLLAHADRLAEALDYFRGACAKS